MMSDGCSATSGVVDAVVVVAAAVAVSDVDGSTARLLACRRGRVGSSVEPASRSSRGSFLFDLCISGPTDSADCVRRVGRSFRRGQVFS